MPKRIRVNDLSPWPERVGCEGVIVDPPEGRDGDIYPWHGLGRNEVVVRLDDDPLGDRSKRRGWSCVMGSDSVDMLDG